MTIEEFRKRMNSGPTPEELKAGFEQRIVDIVNKTVGEREDFKKMKQKINDLEAVVEKLQSTINTLTGNVPEEPK